MKKQMKKNLKIIALLLITVLFTNCKSTQSNSKKPFTITKATYQNWYGGQEGVRGIKIEIQATVIESNITYNSVYFKNKKGKIKLERCDNHKIHITSNINTGYRKHLKNMHSNHQKEYGNKVPVKNSYPDLKENEAVLKYTQHKEEKTIKIILTKKKDIFYP